MLRSSLRYWQCSHDDLVMDTDMNAGPEWRPAWVGTEFKQTIKHLDVKILVISLLRVKQVQDHLGQIQSSVVEIVMSQKYFRNNYNNEQIRENVLIWHPVLVHVIVSFMMSCSDMFQPDRRADETHQQKHFVFGSYFVHANDERRFASSCRTPDLKEITCLVMFTSLDASSCFQSFTSSVCEIKNLQR